MKNTFKKIVASAMTMVAMATSVVGMSANAGDTSDSGYRFKITVGEWTKPQYTDGRRKYDNSSVYVRLDTTGISVSAQTQGSYDITSHWVNNTSRGTVTLTSGKWEIYNNIYEYYVESGRHTAAYVRLKMWAPDDKNEGTISGVWSPDCGGKYSVAN